MGSIEKQSRQDLTSGTSSRAISDDDRWGVAVDGREIAPRFDEAYDAWNEYTDPVRPWLLAAGNARTRPGLVPSPEREMWSTRRREAA